MDTTECDISFYQPRFEIFFDALLSVEAGSIIVRVISGLLLASCSPNIAFRFDNPFTGFSLHTVPSRIG